MLLYGYGGFDIALTPTFSVGFAAWLERGGSARGGQPSRWRGVRIGLARRGAPGPQTERVRRLLQLRRWLAEAGWSRPGRIAIQGGSNGGLLVGACITQRPELFGAAVAEVGVFDMLRFHLFTIGWAWKSDYGDPEDPEAFVWLRAYSPLHNVHRRVAATPRPFC